VEGIAVKSKKHLSVDYDQTLGEAFGVATCRVEVRISQEIQAVNPKM